MIAKLDRPELQAWLNSSKLQQAHRQQLETHGKWNEWKNSLTSLPVMTPQSVSLNAADDVVKVGRSHSLSADQLLRVRETLQQFQPWRKGPYEVCGQLIDSEWRSNLKWDRFKHAIQPLNNRIVLDVGCGNGYFAWRMLHEGAQLVIGIDPYPLYVVQFQAIRHFTGHYPLDILAVRMEDLPDKIESFDSVFSMGVLYHRKSAFDHLIELRNCLRPGGELILETIVIDGPKGMTLLPENRYASMRNVWLLPTCLTLESWLKRCGFCDIQLIDVTRTTPEEQRTTAAMPLKSLVDFLDPNNTKLTVEGYPAPQRAVFIAQKAS